MQKVAKSEKHNLIKAVVRILETLSRESGTVHLQFQYILFPYMKISMLFQSLLQTLRI